MRALVPILLITLAHLSFQDQIKSVGIKPVDKDTSETSVNNAAKQCGGAGKLITQRNSACKVSTPEVCTFTPDNKEFKVETIFEASKDFENLAWRVSAKIDGKDTDYRVDHDDEVPESSAKKGQLAHLHSTIIPMKDFKGEFAVKYEIYDPTDKAVEVCVEVKFNAP